MLPLLFPQKEKKGLAKSGHPETSNKHTQMQGEEERKSPSALLNERGSSGISTLVSKIAVKQGLQVCKGREEEHKFKAYDIPELQDWRTKHAQESTSNHPPWKWGQHSAAQSSGWKVSLIPQELAH